MENYKNKLVNDFMKNDKVNNVYKIYDDKYIDENISEMLSYIAFHIKASIRNELEKNNINHNIKSDYVKYVNSENLLNLIDKEIKKN